MRADPQARQRTAVVIEAAVKKISEEGSVCFAPAHVARECGLTPSKVGRYFATSEKYKRVSHKSWTRCQTGETA